MYPFSLLMLLEVSNFLRNLFSDVQPICLNAHALTKVRPSSLWSVSVVKPDNWPRSDTGIHIAGVTLRSKD
jgi:hypothetical protein